MLKDEIFKNKHLAKEIEKQYQKKGQKNGMIKPNLELVTYNVERKQRIKKPKHLSYVNTKKFTASQLN